MQPTNNVKSKSNLKTKNNGYDTNKFFFFFWTINFLWVYDFKTSWGKHFREIRENLSSEKFIQSWYQWISYLSIYSIRVKKKKEKKRETTNQQSY